MQEPGERETSYGQVTFQGPAGPLVAMAVGPTDGRPVLLLHGFPEFWYGWRKQMQPLADAGFRVIVPDQRGYNNSAKPTDLASYSLPHLISDVLAIAHQLGDKRICLAGHDCGGIVAWHFATQYPDLIHRVAILNAPHPAVARRYLTTNVRQMLRSSYVLWFQVPRLPELLFTAGDFRLAERALLHQSSSEAFTAHDLERYREAWRQPGALTAMLNWYRAAFRSPAKTLGQRSAVTIPTKIIWGMADPFLLPTMARDSLTFCSQGDLVEIPDAGHWLQHEKPETVNRELLEFFRSSDDRL